MLKIPVAIFVGDLVEKNGKTIKENNLACTHKIPLGTIVEVEMELYSTSYDERIEVDLKGKCRLYVVGHLRDCDGTPLYAVSDIPVKYPEDARIFSPERIVYDAVAKVIEYGYGEESLRPIEGQNRELYSSVEEMFAPDEGPRYEKTRNNGSNRHDARTRR